MNDDLSLLLNSLNDPQRQAVAAPLGHQRVLAGAGSGKTRVLVHRIAWLIQVEHASPHSILAVTFTNKAAAEMRARIEQLLGINPAGMWVGTFHGLAHRLLRAHWREAGLPEGFQILDSDDQLRLVKRVVRELGLDEQRWPPRQAQWFINAQKDEGNRPQNIQASGDLYLATMVSVYQAYEEACARAGVVDFAELLLRSLDLWRNDPSLLAHYQRRFRHILVDEFQDTNAVQYAWLRLLAKGGESLMVVGDDDQSIYGWRGAKIENIQQFADDFAGTEDIRLEQNYRSTATILKAANALIANNHGRLGKELWTDGVDGEPITLYAGFNEHDEARYIVETIEDALRKDGLKRSEIAILYRSNAQSRVLEEALLREKIPYRIYGGQRFFERAEIKNALAYLRLIRLRDDDAALERVVNIPPRGIGEKTVEAIRNAARLNGTSMWRAINDVIAAKAVTGRAASALNGFLETVDLLAQQVEGMPLHQMTQTVIEQSGLISYHKEEKGEKGQARVENLEELVSAARAFENPEDEDIPPLVAFLDHTALEAGDTQADAFEDSVQLMTLHSAKGLEFPLVFLAGMEEGLFPHKMSLEEPGRLEEERRLAYVGITRAMQRLVLTYAETRRLYGSETYNKVSRFVREIPPGLIQEVRLSNSVSRPLSGNQRSGSLFSGAGVPETPFALGQSVRHPLFGDGVILNFEGSGAQARVQVNFDSEGSKWLMLGYAKLEAV
ncbi:DNA helicase II [Pseudomonas citronellolis]|uniref:DNA helicase II n=1 Tax=Pseudomonas citronellolis TaxID=53408 RepID=UPI00209F3174|nr:DNA helicase II [Pseudomonas citronellolis]MCP1606778.1 DNA helicase-2/ATP-dependent DNA helicase PcrA [Pseudomonas citronellolis]MCP1641433.1 DNA helicase-2/ATP-dependent DNA helicase PcrA [Pseudomonas citronellolis]MCP1657485.1 DNA helicase-2/ATP-dependent DNA helicase PcrA [Pseudomonas citronellolis]MCP1664351.1 DNA helicase-2/ATP-dependent DNA helicase PcrA [Pseudomonas citronellolis]MCP1695325.1 DNA helicase-2/ATP-dependent DNA helicase PcrA [Pseudomonas citronellolis]